MRPSSISVRLSNLRLREVEIASLLNWMPIIQNRYYFLLDFRRIEENNTNCDQFVKCWIRYNKESGDKLEANLATSGFLPEFDH